MKKLLNTWIAMLLVLLVNGQGSPGFYEKGYVQLKNGTVLKGRYLYSSDLEKVRVVSGKNSWIFSADEVENISRKKFEKPLPEGLEFPVSTPGMAGVFNITEAGVISGNPANSQSAPLILGTSLNHTVWRNLSAGLGIGVEFLKETYLPATANLMYRFRDSQVTPVAVVQAGYQIPLETSRSGYYDVVPDYISSRMIWPNPFPVDQSPLTAKGGFLFNPAVGLITHLRSGYGFIMTAGYRFHRLRYEGENDYTLDIGYNRLSVKLGIIIK